MVGAVRFRPIAGQAVLSAESLRIAALAYVTYWPLSSFTALQKCGRYRINSGQTAPSCLTGSAAFDPQRTCASDPVRDRIWWPCVQELWGEGRVHMPVDAGKLTGEPHLLRPARIIVVSNAKRIARVLVAGRIGVISAYGAVVITRGYHRCTDGSGTNAHTYAAAHIRSAISASSMNAARADTAAIRQSFCRNTRDAKDSSCGR